MTDRPFSDPFRIHDLMVSRAVNGTPIAPIEGTLEEISALLPKPGEGVVVERIEFGVDAWKALLRVVPKRDWTLNIPTWTYKANGIPVECNPKLGPERLRVHRRRAATQAEIDEVLRGDVLRAKER